jgi:type IV pilus assembly protein PilN
MKVNVNLASRPYEDAGRFYRIWIPLLVVLALLTFAASARAISVYRQSRVADHEMAKIDQRLGDLDRQRRDAEATLNLPENSGTRDAAQFLNEAFRLKGFSWTQVMSDLEQIVPNGVQVVSIKPVLTQNNELEASLNVVSPHRDRVIELVRRMEMNPRFPSAEIRSEKTTEKGLLEAEIRATYAPPRPQ